MSTTKMCKLVNLIFLNVLILIVIKSEAQLNNSTRPAYNLIYPTLSPKVLNINTGRLNSDGQRLFYPVDSRDYRTEINSMKQFHDQPLPFRLPFFGFAFHYIWIHKDGYVCFNKGLKSYTFPVSFPVVPSDTNIEEDPSMIAIWFANQDIPQDVEESGVYYRLIEMGTETDEELKDMILWDFDTAMSGSAGFVPTFVMIITWKNMTFANKRPDRPLKTNTYQMVIGTDEISTFVFYNYEWITWITHLDNYDGLNGPPAYIGFNAGNSTRSFEYVPYSQNPRISLMPVLGYGNNLLGRFIFQIDNVLFPGSCINKDLDPNLPDRLGLTTSVNFILSLGGEMLNVTGPCFSPDSVITCRFDSWKVKGKYFTENIASCITPPVMFEGYVDLTVTVDEKTFFYTRMYIQSPESRREFDVWVPEVEMLEKMPDLLNIENQVMTIRWNNNGLHWDSSKRVTISVWGYQEKADSLYPTLKWVADIVEGIPNSGEYLLDLNNLPDIKLDRYDYHFGFIGVNQTKEEFTITQWSKPMPLGWFLRKHWRREYGPKWNERFCKDWFDRETEEDRFATTVFRCPCTLTQSDLDRGRFSPDQQCNVVDKKCDALHHGAQHCVRTSRPSIGGSGQQCCYDDYGELIQSADTMYGGRPSRAFVYGKHPFKMRMMTPTLSLWQYDIMPFFYCCKWAAKEDNSETCQMFNYWRTSQDCSSYQPPAIASVFGDPHIITFDRVNYTFNGKGEFALIHTDNPVHKLDIHARFEQIPNSDGTYLTAVAVRDNVSAIVEFRLRPPAARWHQQIFLIADKEYLFYWHDNMRSIHAKGVTVYEPAGIRNMSHMIAMFDSGAGVEVMVSPVGSLILNVYLPNTFINSTRGLLGKWSNDPNDDFELPDGKQGLRPPADTQRIHQEFGQQYRLFETRQKHLPQSLFFHDVVSHSHYDDYKFEPKFDIKPEDFEDFPDIDRICSDSFACIYDYVVTQDSAFGEQTKKTEAMANNMHQEISEKVIRCPALPKPMNGRKTENRYWPGTIVRFACDEGYRLIGYEVRRCREDGLWSWGVDPQCIRVLTYSLLLSGVFIGVILPVLIIIIIFVLIWRKGRYMKEQKPESAPKLPPKTYKPTQNGNHLLNETKVIPKAETERSLKSMASLQSTDQSYGVDNDFTDDDDDSEQNETEGSLGILEQMQKRNYSENFTTKADVNRNSQLTSSRSIGEFRDTLV